MYYLFITNRKLKIINIIYLKQFYLKFGVIIMVKSVKTQKMLLITKEAE